MNAMSSRWEVWAEKDSRDKREEEKEEPRERRKTHMSRKRDRIFIKRKEDISVMMLIILSSFEGDLCT
jgi:hypothetical protein